MRVLGFVLIAFGCLWIVGGVLRLLTGSGLGLLSILIGVIAAIAGALLRANAKPRTDADASA